MKTHIEVNFCVTDKLSKEQNYKTHNVYSEKFLLSGIIQKIDENGINTIDLFEWWLKSSDSLYEKVYNRVKELGYPTKYTYNQNCIKHLPL